MVAAVILTMNSCCNGGTGACSSLTIIYWKQLAIIVS